MFNLLATRAPGNYTDSNLLVDSATGSDPSLEGVETGSHRSQSHQARGYTTASRFSRLTAPVQSLATKTVAVAGTTAALSPAAMAADPAVSSFDMVDLVAMGVICFAAGMALESKVVSAVNWALDMAEDITLDIRCMGEDFVDRITSRSPMAPRVDSAPSSFEMAKQRALSRVLPSLDGIAIPKGAELVALPSGEFMMGDANSGYNSREKPAHQVVLSAFYMMEKDVSHAFFQHFRPSHKSYINSDGSNLPVVKVDHNDALDFADWMNENHGVAGMKWRLPTEAEMEYAMRGKGQRATDAVAPERVNVRASGHGKILDVDSEAHRNNYGLIHIRGNVWKWCLDRYGKYSANSVINPRGATEGDRFVLRGGAYHSYDNEACLAYRMDVSPVYGDSFIGFRLVLAFEAE